MSKRAIIYRFTDTELWYEFSLDQWPSSNLVSRRIQTTHGEMSLVGMQVPRLSWIKKNQNNSEGWYSTSHRSWTWSKIRNKLHCKV